MKTPTFKEQFDKLTRAYIANTVNPNGNCACFVGNILGTGKWGMHRDSNYFDFDCLISPTISDHEGMVEVIKEHANGFYHPLDIIKLEETFLNTFYIQGGGPHDRPEDINDDTRKENALYVAFEATLDLLKQIHLSKGEVIDETPVFIKRQLQMAIN